MKMIRNAFSRIKRVFRSLWFNSMSSQEYIVYLRKHGIKVGDRVNMRYPSLTTIDVTRPCLVELGNDLDINAYFTIITHDFATFVFRNFYHDFVNGSGKVKIGNNIVFGRNVTILKGVSIGDNCIIGAGSVVSKSIPSNSVAVGVPAKVVCSLEEYYERRKSKQVTEAIDFAKELASVRGGVDNLSICDFPEEWVLFLTEEEYCQNESVQRLVDFRLKNYCDIQEFLNRPKPFNGFEDFKKSINYM